MKAVIVAFNQEKALEEAFSVIVKPLHNLREGLFEALARTCSKTAVQMVRLAGDGACCRILVRADLALTSGGAGRGCGAWSQPAQH